MASDYTWFTVPKGFGFRAALNARGEALPCQFLPAPFGRGRIEGLLLVRTAQGDEGVRLTEGPEAPPRAIEPFAKTCGQGLRVETPGGCFVLEDGLKGGGRLDGGDYRLFDGDVRAEAAAGELFDWCRVYATPLGGDGKALAGVTACYDFVRLKDAPLTQIFACFDAPASYTVSEVRFAQLVIGKSAYTGWSAGRPACGGTFEPDPETRTVPILQGTIPAVDYETKAGYEIMFEHYMGLTGPDSALALVGSEVNACYYPHTRFGAAWWAVGVEPYRGLQNLDEYGADNPLTASLISGDAARAPEAWLSRLPRIVRTAGEAAGRTAVIESGDLRATFGALAGGVRLEALEDRKTGRRLLGGGAGPLISLQLRDPKTQRELWLNSSEGWGQVSLAASEGALEIALSGHPAAPGLGLRLTGRADRARSRISWRVSADNASEIWALVACGYPRLHFDWDGPLDLITPYQSGKRHADVGACAVSWHGDYSNLWCPMPLLAACDPEAGRGLYCAVHDSAPYTKRVRLDKHFGGYGGMGLTYVAEDSERAGNGQALSGEAVWQLFDGDWYDAAAVYRDFVGRRAEWMPRIGDDGARTDTPAWMGDIGLWAVAGVTDDNDWVSPMIALQQRVGVPLAVHLYSWHKIPFDTCYPHYFPVKDSTLPGIRRLQAAGIRVMPYINARLWDVHDDEDYEKYTGVKPDITFNKEGLRSATMAWDGTIYREAYISRRLNGERVRLNGACLSQGCWHDVVENLCRRIYTELGVDGVYLDQMSGGSFAPCYHPDHGHPLGEGGVWYMRGAQAMMKRLNALRERLGVAGIYTSEQNAEVYCDILDGQLVWHWSSGGLIPFYPAVYSDRIGLFGRNFPLAKTLGRQDRLYARLTFAEQLTFGDQPGWGTAFLTNPGQTEADLAFYIAALRLRHKFRAYYTHGRLLRPPQVTCGAAPIVTHHTSDYNTSALYGPGVSAALRAHPTDGTRLLVLVNVTDEAQPCRLKCDLPDGEVLFEGLPGAAAVTGGALSVTLPPLSALMGVWRGPDRQKDMR